MMSTMPLFRNHTKFLLLADSGSTKTEWCLVAPDGSTRTAFTGGLNPYYHTEESITEILRGHLIPEIGVSSVDAIYFYGAGCTGDERTEMLSGVLKSVFGTPEVEVHSDILGSVRAVCGRQPGIAGILGTGANSCQYDGEKIVDNVPVLGFILGDEGSAGYFGRKVLQGYFYREMPEELKKDLESEYDMQRSVILENVYKKSQPNTYVAGFARFAGKHADHSYMRAILKAGLEECVERHILKYRGAETMPVGFVGSVAYYNADLLREVLVEKGLKPGEIIKNPMPNLVKYHSEG
jgi:glucosamine kinase